MDALNIVIDEPDDGVGFITQDDGQEDTVIRSVFVDPGRFLQRIGRFPSDTPDKRFLLKE